MKEYMVYAYRIQNGSRDASFGPFQSRAEADATARQLSALGKYSKVEVVTIEN